ncbi:MAG: hypothetical protein WBX15_16490 [Thermoanaerobaculia bacterium]
MKKSHIALWAAACLVAAGSLLAAEPQVAVNPLTCIRAGDHQLVTAHITGTSPIISARVVFHASDASDCKWSYVQMRHGDGDGWWAVLPISLAGTPSVQYRVTATDQSGAQTSTDVMNAAVTRACTAPALTDEQARVAQNLVVGWTDGDQHQVPCGFSCKDIVAALTPSGEMHPVVCKVAAVPIWQPVALIGAGVGLGQILHEDHKGNPPVISPSRP